MGKTKIELRRIEGLNRLKTTLTNMQEKISKQNLPSSFRCLVRSKQVRPEHSRFCLNMAVSTVAALMGNVLLGGRVGLEKAAQLGAVSAVAVLATDTIVKGSRRRHEGELDESSAPMTMDEVMDVARWQSSK